MLWTDDPEKHFRHPTLSSRQPNIIHCNYPSNSPSMTRDVTTTPTFGKRISVANENSDSGKPISIQ